MTMKDHDGRRFRSERTRKALLDACVAYMREAHIPEHTEVTSKAGVGVRSLYYHFGTIGELHSEALRIILGNGKSLASSSPRGTTDHLAEHSRAT